MDWWVLALVLYFTLLHGVTLLVLVRMSTSMEIITRAIPLGTARVMERRPPGGSTAQHRGEV